MHIYKYPRPSVTVDIAIIIIRPVTYQCELLVIKRKNNPFKGQYALPGGFIEPGESPEIAALRELKEEAGVELTEGDIYQLHIKSALGRDPRGWTISIPYLIPIKYWEKDKIEKVLNATAGDDASEVKWINLNRGYAGYKDLAFDHFEIVKEAENVFHKITH